MRTNTREIDINKRLLLSITLIVFITLFSCERDLHSRRFYDVKPNRVLQETTSDSLYLSMIIFKTEKRGNGYIDSNLRILISKNYKDYYCLDSIYLSFSEKTYQLLYFDLLQFKNQPAMLEFSKKEDYKAFLLFNIKDEQELLEKYTKFVSQAHFWFIENGDTYEIPFTKETKTVMYVGNGG